MPAIAQIIYERKAFSPVNLNPNTNSDISVLRWNSFPDIFAFGQSGLVKFKIVLDENTSAHNGLIISKHRERDIEH